MPLPPAGISRQKDIFVMAANYLRTLNWHDTPEYMKSIIQFYTKAQAVESLAAFYESCAQVEVDEYRDYEKALQALREAARYMSKSRSMERDARLARISEHIMNVEKFVQVGGLGGGAFCMQQHRGVYNMVYNMAQHSSEALYRLTL